MLKTDWSKDVDETRGRCILHGPLGEPDVNFWQAGWKHVTREKSVCPNPIQIETSGSVMVSVGLGASCSGETLEQRE